MKNLVCELTNREAPVPPEKVREWRAGLRSLMELLVDADRKQRKNQLPTPAPSPELGRAANLGEGEREPWDGQGVGQLGGTAPTFVNSVAQEVTVV